MGVGMAEVSRLPVLVLVATALLHNVECVLKYNILEKLNPGSFVADIIADAKSKGEYNDSGDTIVSSDRQYALLPGRYHQLFSVDEKTGVLQTRVPIDRDSLCATLKECIMSLEAALIRPADIFQVFNVEVTIEDVNDHAPTFGRAGIMVSILESALLENGLYSLPSASDSDAGAYSVQGYSLSHATPGSNNTFGLRVMTSDDGTNTPNLMLLRSLDRESQANYVLQLIASDGGQPPRTGTLSIDVVVLDVNDNSPVFDVLLYNVTIVESIEAFTVIAQVHAVDRDEGLNGLCSYRLTNPTRDLYGDLFRINNVTGKVFLTRQLDPDFKEVYNVMIAADDHGLEPRSTMVRMIVNVHDINSHSPMIRVSALIESGLPEILENQPAGTFVAYIYVEDPDRGPNGDVICSVSGPNFLLQLVHPKMYKMVTAVVFDREQSDQTVVLVQCSDLGKPSLASEEPVEVHILDQNDNNPQFSKKLYQATVVENNAIGVSILTVSATDKDEGINAALVFSLTPNDHRRYVKIDPETGVVTTDMAFDYEAMVDVQFEIVVSDSGIPALSSRATVRISVINVDDCAPAFMQPAFSFGIFENMPPGTDVGTVSAVDHDASPFNYFYYQFRPASVSDLGFRLDRNTGKITTKMFLDRENTSIYYMSVWVVDVNNASLASSSSVTIYVADKNDNDPVILFPRESNNTVQVSSYAPRGYTVTKIQAFDSDIGVNAMLVYSIFIDGIAASNLFDVDSNNGAVYLSGGLQDQLALKFKILVTVTDQGIPRRSASALLKIHVNSSISYAIAQSLLLDDSSNDGGKTDFGFHQKVIIVLASVTAILVFLLIAAIFFVKLYRISQYNGETTGEHHQRRPLSNSIAPVSKTDQSDATKSSVISVSLIKSHIPESNESFARVTPLVDIDAGSRQGSMKTSVWNTHQHLMTLDLEQDTGRNSNYCTANLKQINRVLSPSPLCHRLNENSEHDIVSSTEFEARKVSEDVMSAPSTSEADNLPASCTESFSTVDSGRGQSEDDDYSYDVEKPVPLTSLLDIESIYSYRPTNSYDRKIFTTFHPTKCQIQNVVTTPPQGDGPAMIHSKCVRPGSCLPGNTKTYEKKLAANFLQNAVFEAPTELIKRENLPPKQGQYPHRSNLLPPIARHSKTNASSPQHKCQNSNLYASLPKRVNRTAPELPPRNFGKGHRPLERKVPSLSPVPSSRGDSDNASDDGSSTSGSFMMEPAPHFGMSTAC